MAENIEDIISSYLSKNKDFGFTGVDEIPLEETLKTSEETVESLKVRMKELEGLVMPLLVNLLQKSKDGSLPAYIHWPQREKPVKDLINKVVKLTRG